MERDLLTAILRTDFPAFIQRAFAEVEPHTELVMEDYILHVAEKLTAVADGLIKHLIINEPPRHLKSPEPIRFSRTTANTLRPGAL